MKIEIYCSDELERSIDIPSECHLSDFLEDYIEHLPNIHKKVVRVYWKGFEYIYSTKAGTYTHIA